MTPSLAGRLQTRVFSVIVLAGAWTLLISPLVNLVANGQVFDGLGAVLVDLVRVLVWFLVLGIGWELVYHGLQQFRWEKDWPTLFTLLTGVNEGLLLWLVISGVPADAFLLHFTTAWLVVFLILNGPIRVLSLHWRFRGGRLL